MSRRTEVYEGKVTNEIVDMYGGNATWDLRIDRFDSIEDIFRKYEGYRIRVTIEELPEIEELEEEEYD